MTTPPEAPSCLLLEAILYPWKLLSWLLTSQMRFSYFCMLYKLCLYSLCLTTFIQYVCEIGPCGCTSLLCSISLFEYTTLWLFSPVDFFHTWAIMSSAALSILAQDFCGTIACISVGYVLRRRIARSWGTCTSMFRFSRYCQFFKVVLIYTPYCMSAPCSYQPLVFSFFFIFCGGIMLWF